MSPEIRDFLILIKDIALILLTALAVTAVFYCWKKKDIFGGFIGGFVVAFIGALIGGLVLNGFFNDIIRLVLTFLEKNPIGVNIVNIIAGAIGAYIALKIIVRLNGEKERKKF